MTLRCEVRELFPQVLVVDVEGDAVPKLVPEVHPEADGAIPNVIELWMRAVEAGLLAGPACPPSACGARILETSPTADSGRLRYRIELRGCDPGALRVLLNLCEGLELTGSIFTEPDQSGTPPPRLEVEAQPYPAAPAAPPFRLSLDLEYGTQVALELATPIDDALADSMIETLELWSLLVAACGYRKAGRPTTMGGMPDGALLFDSHTVTEGFSEMFDSDPAAFHAVCHYAQALHDAHHPVAAVTVA